jgi:hypothetical protein
MAAVPRIPVRAASKSIMLFRLRHEGLTAFDIAPFWFTFGFIDNAIMVQYNRQAERSGIDE